MAKERIEGIGDLFAKFATLKNPKVISQVLRSATREGMKEPAKRARALIPQGVDEHRTYQGNIVAPGFARKSIRVIARALKGGAAYAVLGVRAQAYYAVQYVELGTSKMRAQPWLRPAFLGSSDPMIRLLGTGINEWIKGVAARKRTEGSTARATQLESTTGQFDE